MTRYTRRYTLAGALTGASLLGLFFKVPYSAWALYVALLYVAFKC